MGEFSVIGLFERGGGFMWPLLGLSIACLTLVLDRALCFFLRMESFGRLVSQLERSIRAGNWLEAERLTGRSRRPLRRLACVYLEQRDKPKEAREDIIRREGNLLLDVFETRIRWLAVVGQLATLLGLLGTVWGLVLAFQQVEKLGGQVQPAALAEGIWAALLTTVFGLIIAIPSIIAYHFFDGLAERLAKRFGLLVSYLDQWCNIGIDEHEPGSRHSIPVTRTR